MMEGLVLSSFHSVVKYLHKMIDANVTFGGEKNLEPESPMFFCSNHFTRFETFVMPNIFYRKLHMKVRSLGDSSLFVGKFADVLDKLGTISTRNERRNEIILSDLMLAKHNWIIYPEGMMMKNKKVSQAGDHFVLHAPDGPEDMHTGAAVLAIKSELEKSRFAGAKKACNLETVEDMRKHYEIGSDEFMSYHSTKIVPVTITYSPMYPGKNRLMTMAESFIDDVSETLLEELEIEGNILFHGSMHIYLGEPIDVAHYILEAKKRLKQENLTIDDDAIINCCKTEITTLMMERIYANVRVNFDHLFAMVIAHWDTSCLLDINEFKTRLYMISHALSELKTVKMDETLKSTFFRILNGEPFELFDRAFALAIKQGIIRQEDDKHICIQRDTFLDEHEFTTIRIKNSFAVVYNEVAMLSNVIDCVKLVLDKPRDVLQRDAFYTLYRSDLDTFKKDYKKFYSLLHSKPMSVGEPFILFNPNNKHGVVLSHGYKSAPKEIEALANFIHSLNFNVYAVRLSGHGTMPEDLRDRSWEDWYDSFNIGYAAISQVSQKIYLAGFSTGGLLTLLSASKKEKKVDGIISINTALRLNDIQFNYVLPTVNILNNFLALFNADIDSTEGVPENPGINYSKHYLTSVGQLKELMEETDEILEEIEAPILIIQGDKDPVVNPESANIIFNKIKSEDKKIVTVKSDYHVIVTRDEKEDVFKAVKEFLVK
jgi:esterase/lipase/1-acyl-sn-glycerol-3-phosphate acyltransferase